MSRSRIIQLGAVAVAIAGIVAAGMLQQPLEEASAPMRGGGVDVQKHPEYGWIQVVPGGVRAAALSYLWIRANELKDNGRYYDAYQLADLICSLNPRFPGVWSFHAWNMAWNISVATHTPEERYRWVTNGMELLRDRAIPLNPKALSLYKELGWLFFSKMGGRTDDMNLWYKRWWATEMQEAIGAPPLGTTSEVIAAFRPIAEAPIDRNPRRERKKGIIQLDRLRAMAAEDKQLSAYLGLLSKADVDPGREFLKHYARFSDDPSVAIVRQREPERIDRKDIGQLAKVIRLIRSGSYEQPRRKLVAFLRAQILWNDYRMDPQWMLQLMERLQAPLDWRLVWPHAMYWVTYGFHVSEGLEMDRIVENNANRIVMNCLKDLTWFGRVAYPNLTTQQGQSRRQDYLRIDFVQDTRYVEPTHREHVRMIRESLGAQASDKAAWKKSIFKSGHVNYLINAVGMLVMAYEMDDAKRYYDYIRDTYSPDEEIFKTDDPYLFALRYFQQEGKPTPRVASGQIRASLHTAFRLLATGNRDGYQRMRRYADMVHDSYAKNAPVRLGPPSMATYMTDVVVEIIYTPRARGLNVSLGARRELLDRCMQVPVTLFGRQVPLSYPVYLYLSRAPALRRKLEGEILYWAQRADPAQRDQYTFENVFPEPEGPYSEFVDWFAAEQKRRAARQGNQPG